MNIAPESRAGGQIMPVRQQCHVKYTCTREVSVSSTVCRTSSNLLVHAVQGGSVQNLKPKGLIACSRHGWQPCQMQTSLITNLCSSRSRTSIPRARHGATSTYYAHSARKSSSSEPNLVRCGVHHSQKEVWRQCPHL